jgi:hypothetical protein
MCSSTPFCSKYGKNPNNANKKARDTRASVEHTGGLLEAMRGAPYARQLEVTGPFPRRRAGTAIWGPRVPVASVEGGRVTLANGSSGPAKAFKPAPYEPPARRVRGKQQG